MKQDKFIKITSSGSTAEAEQIVQYLNNNGIPAYCQNGIMDIYMGNAAVNSDIMVAEKDQKNAQKVLEGFQPIKTAASGCGRNFSKGQRVMGWALLILILLCIAVPLFFM